MLINCSYAETHGIVNVDVMAVNKDSRRLGLGKGLMHMSELVARNSEAEGITLQVVENNEAGKKLYLGIGFNIVGRRKRYYSDGTDALEMHKDLPAAAASNDADHPAAQRPEGGFLTILRRTVGR